MESRPSFKRLSEPVSETPGFDLGNSFSHTRRGTFSSCERKLALGAGLSLRTVTTPVPLRMGSQFGLCLEHRDPQAHIADYEAEIEKVSYDQEKVDYLKKEAGCISVMAEGYLARYGHDEEREIYLELPIEGTGLLDRGFADFRNGDLFGEDKFRARWTWDQKRHLLVDPQVSAYLSLARRLGLTDRLEVEYRVTIRPYIRKKDTVQEFLTHLRTQLASKPHEYFHQMTVTRTLQELRRSDDQIKRLAHRMEQSMAEGEFPQNFSACQTYGLCEFFDLCSRDGRIPEGQYKVETEGRSTEDGQAK